MERLRQECELQRITFAEFVLVTFDRWYGRLDELFPPLAPRTSALPPRKPPRRSRVPNLTPLQLMVTDEELRVLEEVQQQHQVGSLSEMLSGVLEAEFGLRLEYRRALRTN